MKQASCSDDIMLTLYSYPELFGVADNNGYGLKVFAFLRLAGVPFWHEHIFDASSAPRGQLPYIIDGGETIGDSDPIIAHLIPKYRLTIDAKLTGAERDIDHLLTRMLDDLYWVMSYSRWKDERFWPLFRDALMREHPSLTPEALGKAQEFNAQRYHFQGIGRYAPDAAYARGLADLKGAGRYHSRERLCAWGEADQHRCRHLRFHRQYRLLRYRHPAQAIRRVGWKHGAPLSRHSRRGDGASAIDVAARIPGAVAQKPITGNARCCARAASGHAAAVPPSSVMNSRRFITRSPRRQARAACPARSGPEPWQS